MTDELRIVRDCLPEQPPPTPDVTVAARDRLTGLAYAPARRAAGRRFRRVPLAGMRPARRALLLRVGTSAMAVAVAAAVAVAVIAVVPPEAHAPPSATDGTPGTGYTPYVGAVPTGNADGTTGGRAVLLTAARTVGQAAETAPERYWVTTGTVGNFVQLGPANDRYMVLEEAGVQNWAARSPKDGSPSLAQQLGAAPVSAADRAAWQRDGAPTKWTYVGQSDSLADPQDFSSGFNYVLSTAAGPLDVLGAGYGAQQFDVGATALTLAQLRALPADPAKLEKLILAGGVAPAETPSAYFLETVPAIMEMPVTPAVRAALYRMLAGMPGMESIGQVVDPTGQQGEAVDYTSTYSDCAPSTLPDAGPQEFAFSSCTIQQILIIDPATGMPMAEELRYVALPTGQQWPAPDGLFSYEIFGQSYWTNQDRPRPPQVPQQAATHGHSGAICITYDMPAHHVVKSCPVAGAGTGKTGTSR
jgi:hypothetical protein